jgi:hypothetical protein
MSYNVPPADPCSACHDNSTMLADKCTGMIDCLGTAGWPSCPDSNCKTNCLNQVGGSGPVATCVDMILTAASCQ